MGQGHSRTEPGSPERHQEHRRSAALTPSSTILENSRPTTLTRSASRRRRYSTNFTNFLLQRSSPETDTEIIREEASENTSQPPRRRSRLSRASSSFTNNIPSIFVRHASPSSRSHDRRILLSPPPAYHGPVRPIINTNTGSTTSQPRLPELDSPRSPLLNPRTVGDLRRQDDDRTASSLADRISSLTPDRGFRNRTAPLRRRRSPLGLGGADDQGVLLSRLLSIVAAATAATLMGGSPEQAMSDLRNATGEVDTDDGTFNGFLHALRNGSLTPQQENAGAEAGSEAAENPASLEFFRMFRFGSASNTRRRQGDSSRPSSSRSTMSDHTSPHGHRHGETGEHRMVPILIVGIRALNGDGEGVHENSEGAPSFLDALTSVPANFNMDLDGTESLLRAHDDLARAAHPQRRRASFGGLNLFSSGRDALRNARLANASRSRSDHPGQPFATSEDSPYGPHPPPSTPASAPLSAMSSGTSSPSGRNSYSRRESFIPGMTGTSLEPTTEESSSYSSPFSPLHHPRPPRHRRLSDSDTPRFGSGSSRRNGLLVEPHPTLDEPPFSSSSNSTATDSSSGSSSSTASANTAATGSGNNRSWIIYILGGSYPEDHPILSTPSLFTDTPTYEDMLLLSSLLGPAKPPVASTEDVAEAPGVLTIKVREDGSGMNAVAVGADGLTVTVQELAAAERCLVCLCNYEDGEEARRLIKCGHLFHRECIDQWLTTGRNSCPLCRGQGVDEKPRPEESTEGAGPHGAEDTNIPVAT